MFDIGYTELLFIAVVALLVIGPKELPNALRSLGRMTGKARAMTRHLRSGFDEMMRQAELEEMEAQWKAHNRKIMESAPAASDFAIDPMAPPADGAERSAGSAAHADDMKDARAAEAAATSLVPDTPPVPAESSAAAAAGAPRP